MDRYGSPSSWAAAVVVAAALSPGPAPCAEPLAVRADPASLVLGTGKAAALVIEGTWETPPTVTTNVGRIESLRPLGAGRFAAEYRPPAGAHPQVAIVAAVADDRWGWTAIPLAGRGMATARSAPGAAIRVTIGDVEFGPVQADAAGRAEVPVTVPAGVAYAYHRDERLELNVPPTLHVHVALGRAAVGADVEQVVPLRIFAVTAAGAPRAGAPVVAEVTRGEIAGLVEIAPGEHVGTLRLSPGAAGRVEVRARLADEPEFASSSALDRLAGPPARIALDAGANRVVAGESGPLTLRVRVTDAAGNGVDAEPSLQATEGELAALVPLERGTWETALGIPAATRAGQTVVTARAAGLEGSVAIDVAAPLLPRAPRERSVSLAPKVGVAAARGGVWSLAVAAEGGFRPGFLERRLVLAIEAGRFVRDRTDEVPVGAELLAVRGRVTYVPVIASARVERAAGARQLGWAAAGGGIVLVASDVSVGGSSARSESGAVPGLRAAIGWGIRAGRATPFAEAGLAWHGAPPFDALRGSLTVLTLSLGCRYDAY
jgi:hypothetical protein